MNIPIGLIHSSWGGTDLARARTFGFLKDVEALWARGLARGGSLDNAVVVNGGQVLDV